MTPDQIYLAVVRLYDKLLKRAERARHRSGSQHYFHQRERARGRLEAYERIVRDLKPIVDP